MKKMVQVFLVSIGLVAIIAVGYWFFYLHGGFGPLYGRVFSLTDLNAEAKSVLERSLQLSPFSEIQFKHASVVGGKDWHLYVCFETPKTNWESCLKSVSFTTRKEREQDAPFEMPALSWWKIEKEKVDSILLATDSYTGLIILNDDALRRVYMYTDGGPSGFLPEVWNLFKSQQ